MISNAEQHFIDLVSDLVKNRISGENTIVLVTVPMTGLGDAFSGDTLSDPL